MHELARFLVETGVFKRGEFVLKSGRKSSYFLDFGQVYSGRALATLGGLYAAFLQERLGEGFDGILGPAYKGIPLAVATCQQLWVQHGREVPYLTFRKEAKAHGERGLVLGCPPAGRRLVLIDDVMTSGQTKVEALAQLQREAPDARVVAVLVAVDREEEDERGRPAAAGFEADTGVPVLALGRISQLLQDMP